jgi:hypothetical protein
MINLGEIPSKDLAKIVKLLQKKEGYEKQMIKIIQEAEKRPSPTAALRNMRVPRNAQPSLRDMIAGILEKASKPMSVAEIFEASLATGYHWRSKQPINALNVKMYTDDTFKKASPGRFVLRKKA